MGTLIRRSNSVLTVPYDEHVYNRTLLRYSIGLWPRFRKHLKYSFIRFWARRRGATIGKNAVLPWSLARKANERLIVGESAIIEDNAWLDLRGGRITIGARALINGRVTILRGSHNLDDPFFATIFTDLVIEEYAWICMGSVIMPQVTRIGRGAVVGAFSVVITPEIPAMQVLAGNPAQVIKERKVVHDKLMVEAMKAGDFASYWKYRRWFKLSRSNR